MCVRLSAPKTTNFQSSGCLSWRLLPSPKAERALNTTMFLVNGTDCHHLPRLLDVHHALLSMEYSDIAASFLLTKPHESEYYRLTLLLGNARRNASENYQPRNTTQEDYTKDVLSSFLHLLPVEGRPSLAELITNIGANDEPLYSLY